ncbi:MAG: HAD-IA family hydrolase [Ardenticatenales bacterium]|nr:HAD-IA family hydrolase [Ardenticatenales bacterium]
MDAAIIFDMDGLLIDSEILWEKVERALLASHGREYDSEIARKHIGMRMDECTALMLREYHIDSDRAEFEAQLVDNVLAEFKRSLTLMAGAEQVMALANSLGVPVAIASSSPMRVVQYVVDHFGWRARLQAICSGEEVARGKPAPDVYLLAAERIGVAPAHCVALEDSLNGARAARAAGMHCIAVPNHAYKPSDFENIAHHIVSSLEDVTQEDLLRRKSERAA